MQANILILEDDAHLLALYSRVLNKAGYHVHPAMTLDTTRDLLRTQRFDIFISDISIGSGRSIDLLRQELDMLRRAGTEIVIASGREEARYMCEEMGIDFFMHKPISPADLRQLIERLLQARVAC